MALVIGKDHNHCTHKHQFLPSYWIGNYNGSHLLFLDIIKMKVDGAAISREQDRRLLEQRGAIGQVKLISNSAPSQSMFFAKAIKDKPIDEQAPKSSNQMPENCH